MEKTSIGNDTLRMTFHLPDADEGYYRGTRFDWAGVFESVHYKGCNYCEQWFETYSPLMHDAVGGPAEEFSAIGFDEALPGGQFLKIGVGMLERIDEQSYDRFLLHKITDPGKREFSSDGTTAVFRHVISSETGYGYDYVKEIEVTGEDTFCIRHKLLNTGTKSLKGDVYNHNFFTLGLLHVAEGRQINFPFRPEGDWRDDFDHVGFTGEGVRFYAPNDKVRSVFSGNVHEEGKGFSGSTNAFEMAEVTTGRKVQVSCGIPMRQAVFWANPRIACVEPYIDFDVAPGESFEFAIDYKLI